MGTYTIDPERSTIRLSARLTQLLRAGDAPLELSLEEYGRRFYHPDDHATGQAKTELAHTAAEPLLIESRVLCGDGTTIWVRSCSSLERDHRGRPCIIGVLQDITTQKQTELALRESEQAHRDREALFRATFDSAIVGVCLTSTEGRYLRVNPAFCKMLGYSAEELSALTFNDITHPADRQAGSEFLARALAGGADQRETDKRYLHRDGREIWARVSVALVTTDGGRARFFVSHVLDITPLRTSEQRFRAVFASVPAALSVSSLADGRFVDVNAEFERAFGWSKAELIGRTSAEMQMWSDSGGRERALQALLSSSSGSLTHVDLKLRRRDGEERDLRSAAHIIDFQGERLLVAAFLDMTEQLRAERHRLRAEQQYRDLVDGVRDVVFALTPDSVINSLNPAFERTTGFARKDWIGRRFDELIHPEDAERARQELHDSISQGAFDSLPFRIKTADGQYRMAEVRAAPRFDDGKLVSILGIARDISERINLEQQLRQAQKMEAVGVLAGGVAHDFNNILGVIWGYGSLLLPEFADDDPKRAQLLEIQASAERAIGLTRQLMSFSRKQLLEPKVVDLNEIVAGLVNMLGRMLGGEIRLVTHPSPERAWVLADPGQLEQVLMNLAVNARDAMPRGGLLSIEIQRAALDTGAAAALDVKSGNYVHLSVSDTGEGMDKATQSRVFEPFFTTKALGKGTGLGLSTVFGIVKQSGGQVVLESAPGKGATFHVWLPLVAGVVSEPAVITRSPLELGGSELILLVEDDPSMRGLTYAILRGAGYEVLEASSGGDALLIAEQRGSEIDLVLTDVAMPLMSGDQLVERLDKLRPGLRAVFMSGNADIGRKGGRDLGSRPFIQKPFRPDEMLRVVRATLSSGTTATMSTATPLSTLLEAVPGPLLERLREATLQARPKRLEQLALELAQYSEPAAAQLRCLVSEFKLDALAAELDAISPDKSR